MVKTLRILSYLLAAAAVCGVVFLVVLGLKGDPEIEAFLNKPGIVDTLKGDLQSASQSEQTVSPLVTQAKKFALRIDPPPPPPPEKPAVATAERQKPESKPPAEPDRPVQIVPPRPVSVRFDLVATARAENDPTRSYALLKPVVGPAKWVRLGEKVEHLEIREIHDGSVVLYQDGKKHSELFVPKPKSGVRSLLKEGPSATAAAHASGPSSVTTTASGPRPQAPAEETTATGPIRVSRDAARQPGKPGVDAQARIQQVTASVRQPSPEEKKESLQRSISSIQQIMQRDDPHLSPEEKKREQEAWIQLLQLLQKEKQTLEENVPVDSRNAGKVNDAEPKGDFTDESQAETPDSSENKTENGTH
jgi:hypothetical protein